MWAVQDEEVILQGYSLIRRDRVGRRGRGVALYVSSTLQWVVWKHDADDRTYELQWLRIGDTYVGASLPPTMPALLNRLSA